jgi:hypothetical protein
MPTPTYVPMATVTLGTAASSVTFSSIPATYRDLVLVVNGANAAGANFGVYCRFNGDTGNNNPAVHMIGAVSAISSGIINELGGAFVGWTSSGVSCQVRVQFMDYSATDKHKTLLSRADNPTSRTSAHAARWTNTGAITSINIFNEASANWASGSTFNLYGIVS